MFESFDDYWSPFLGGQGPAPGYCMSLPEPDRIALPDRIRTSLPAETNGKIRLVARAWAVRGVVSGCYDRGETAWLSKMNATIRRLNELIERNPENAEFLVQRGYAWQDAKDFARAMADFERAVAVEPFCVSALAASANLRYKMGDYDGSIDDSSRAVGIEPDNVMALCTRAAAYLKKGEPERALEGFERVLHVAPGQRGALHWRGVAKEALGDVEGAQRDFALSTSLKPPLEPG